MSDNNNQWKNKLYFGDNLDILRDKISDDSVDLIYLDPPFQSGKSYNQIFTPEHDDIKGATAQIEAFADTWKWGVEAEKNYNGLITGEINKEKPNQKLIDLMKSMRSYLGEVPMMAYLSMMAPRLLEMRRVLKSSGSIYLHCDPTASHYLKLLMDAIFGTNHFVNEIVWCYTGPRKSPKAFARKHDVILFYTKSDSYNFNQPRVPHKSGVHNTGQVFGKEEEGSESIREELEAQGKVLEDWWMDIWSTDRYRNELIGYPTQKPEKLLERIINASSSTGDVVLDPFCGCGTTVAVAQKLNRRWIGIDITYLAIDVIAKRLESSKFIIKKGVDFVIEGEPKDVYSATKLAEEKPFQFEVWAISRLDASPSQSQTGDQGVDGIINFFDLTKKDKANKGIVQVKGTKTVNPSMVRDLKGTIKSQGAEFGVLITLQKPTQGMINEATKEGYYEFQYAPGYEPKKIPKIQFLTVDDLFKEPLPIILPPILPPYKKPALDPKADQAGFFE